MIVRSISTPAAAGKTFYRIGDTDPRIRFDAGAGDWNSHSKAAAVVAERAELEAVVDHAGGNLGNIPSAGDEEGRKRAGVFC